MTPDVIVDCAGASVGGAARFLDELDLFLSEERRFSCQVIGRGRTLAPGWLVRRELMASAESPRVALNNVSFFRSGGRRTVLLRNALHFCEDSELADVTPRTRASIRAQRQVVRASLRMADVVVVPSSSMAARVAAHAPAVEDRLVVRHHPVTPRPWAGSAGWQGELLVPILNAPYKKLERHLQNLLNASNETSIETVHVTADPDEFPGLRRDPRLHFVGRLTNKDLDGYWASSKAIYFPTRIESFGYPLAEARANGRRVVALGTPQNQEIGGPALAPFIDGDAASLAAALDDSMTKEIAPDPAPFDPPSYFDWLLGGGDGRA